MIRAARRRGALLLAAVLTFAACGDDAGGDVRDIGGTGSGSESGTGSPSGSESGTGPPSGSPTEPGESGE